MATATNPEQVFFEGRYSYRRFFAYVLVAVLGTTGAVALVGSTWKLLTGDFQRPLLPGLLIGGLWLAGAWVPSLYLGWRLLFHPYCNVRIDASGITIDARRIPWSKIEYIGGRRSGRWPRKPKIHPMYHLRSRWPLKSIRWIPAEMSEDEYDKLMDDLADYLGSAFPHVTIA